MGERMFGWNKDKFNDRALYLEHWAMHENVTLKILPKTDLRKYTEPLNVPWNQLKKGACTGFGIGVNSSARAVEQGVFNRLNQRFSPEWIYDGELEIEGNLGQDAGASPEDGFLWLERHGCLPEEFDLYTEKIVTDSPDSDPVKLIEAAKWPCTGHFRVDNGTYGLKAALSVGNFVSIGIPFWAKWLDAPTNGILPDVTPFDEIAGGHEMCTFGFFPVGIGKKIYFITLNSWGTDYGDGGWCYIPAQAFNVAKVIGGYDAMFPRLPWKK